MYWLKNVQYRQKESANFHETLEIFHHELWFPFEGIIPSMYKCDKQLYLDIEVLGQKLNNIFNFHNNLCNIKNI